MNAFRSLASSDSRVTSADAAQLSSYLRDELTIQDVVQQRLVEKERLIVKQDTAGLQALLAECEPVLQHLEELTQRRLRILSLIGRRLGLPAEDITMQEVIDHTDEPDRAELADLREKLRDRLQQVGRLNRRVNVLIRHALDTNRALLHVLFGERQPRARGYAASGQPVDTISPSPHFSREL